MAAIMPWRWQSFGGATMLVTDGGGARVVLAGGRALLTRDEATGRLVEVTGKEPIARLIGAAPQLLKASHTALAEVDSLLAAFPSSERLRAAAASLTAAIAAAGVPA